MGEEEKMSKKSRNNVYNKPGKASNNSPFGQLMLSIIILGVVALIFINFALPLLKQSVKKVAAQKTVDIITENAEKIAASNPEVAEILDSLTEEDKEVVSEIIENHMDNESISEVMEYVKDGNQEELIKYATENLTPEEMTELIGIYGKHALTGEE